MPRKSPKPKASRSPTRSKAIASRVASRAGDFIAPAAEDAAARTAARAIEPDARPIVQVPPGTGGLNLRATPGGTLIMTLSDGTFLSARESAEAVRTKVGVPNQWLAVATTAGKTGFVAAQWLKIVSAESHPTPKPPTPPTPSPSSPPISADIAAQNTVFAARDMTLANGWRITAGTPLRVTENNWAGKVGDPNQFIQVQSYAFKPGSVPGSSVVAPTAADVRAVVNDANVAFGISAWTFGMHDPFDRGLFAGSNKTGWVLITSLVGSDPLPNYADWALAGYGVIGRLNNDYGGSGTIPTPDRYDEFAMRCADWVQAAQAQIPGRPELHRRVWIIGNEMNNPREWPEEGRNPSKAIQPEQYADCFNRARRAIQARVPNAIVVPGAIDPYNAAWGNPLDYWNRMLANIQDLDGLALHAYTHGPEPSLITSLGTFGDDPLRWQYFDFRCYTPLLDVVPQKWRGKPAYITETNATPHNNQPAWSGGRNGWVPEAYREVARWNAQPHAQQIQALILYRWIRGGGNDAQFAISEKPGVQDDFRDAIRGQDNRWRA